MDYSILGENIRTARRSVGITQERLAESVDLSTAFISQIERGVRKASLETVYKISVFLEITVDELLKSVSADDESPSVDKITILLKNRTAAEIRLSGVLIENLLNNLENGIIIK